jgi:hypothetical protein
MCGNRRRYQPPAPHAPYGAPAAACAPYGPRGGCHGRRQGHQGLLGLAVGAAITAIEKRNQRQQDPQQARAQMSQYSNEFEPTTSRSRQLPGDRYETESLERMVSDISLEDKKSFKTDGSAERNLPPPGVAEGELPPAYTPTAEPSPSTPIARNTPNAVAAPAPSQSLPQSLLNLPLLSVHGQHPTIMADLDALSVAHASYQRRQCGGLHRLKRARKQLVYDLGVLEAARLREAGASRWEAKRSLKSGRREMRAGCRDLRRGRAAC